MSLSGPTAPGAASDRLADALRGDRRLTSIHAIGQSLAIGPMFSAGLLTGLVASAAAFDSPLSVLLGSIGAMCLASVILLFARRDSGAGAVDEYLVHGAHPSVGPPHSRRLVDLGGARAHDRRRAQPLRRAPGDPRRTMACRRSTRRSASSRRMGGRRR